MIYYTPDHEWIRVEGDVATVGITQHAADTLGDLVLVEVKPVGSRFDAAAIAAIVESVKAASDIYAPIAGQVTEINPRVGDEPGLVNADPEGDGWMFKLQIANEEDLSGLLDRDAYDRLISTL
jgi:glycine cleavage system H protein